jgi:hypothetical protein
MAFCFTVDATAFRVFPRPMQKVLRWARSPFGAGIVFQIREFKIEEAQKTYETGRKKNFIHCSTEGT